MKIKRDFPTFPKEYEILQFFKQPKKENKKKNTRKAGSLERINGEEKCIEPVKGIWILCCFSCVS